MNKNKHKEERNMSGKTIQRRSKTSLGLSLAGALVALLTMAFQLLSSLYNKNNIHCSFF